MNKQVLSIFKIVITNIQLICQQLYQSCVEEIASRLYFSGMNVSESIQCSCTVLEEMQFS